ncbi:hypothetical protein Tco_0000591 [Tanacetum coccineum]
MSPELDRFVIAVKLNKATIQDGRVVVQNVQGRQNQNQRYFARGNGTAGNGGAQNRAGNANAGQGKLDKMLLMQAQENGAVLDEEELLFLAGEQGNTFDADVDNQPVQDLALNEDNIFQADECEAFDLDVDDEPTAQSIFMANLSSVRSANPQVGPSNASILSEVPILENVIDHSISNQDEHEIHNKVQPSDVINTTSVHMGNSNVIPYEQYFLVNDISGVPSCASSTLNSVCVLPVNDTFIPHDPIATELKIYKEQLQLKSTMENNKIIEETVTTLKQEFKQKDSKFLTGFSNLKHLNDKLKNKLHSQDQSIQTVHMMLNPTQPHSSVLFADLIVSTSEEELELAEATRNKLHVKMNDSVCVEKRYFGHLDLANEKDDRTKGQYNTPTVPTTLRNIKLVKSVSHQQGITEGERGFEQTKRCYLTEVIPFFNLLKEHFEGIQKSLVTEVRAMKAVFENLEAEVDQNETDLRSGEIERKNLLITNENLVAECLSKDVFYTATDSVLNVSRFSDMHDAFTSAQKRIADLESENFNLRNKIQHDDHDSMIKHFSKLKVEHFNLQLKYQNLKEHFGNKKPMTSSDTPLFDSLFVIGKLNEQIQIRGNTIRELNEAIRFVNVFAPDPNSKASSIWCVSSTN